MAKRPDRPTFLMFFFRGLQQRTKHFCKQELDLFFSRQSWGGFNRLQRDAVLEKKMCCWPLMAHLMDMPEMFAAHIVFDGDRQTSIALPYRSFELLIASIHTSPHASLLHRCTLTSPDVLILLYAVLPCGCSRQGASGAEDRWEASP